MRVEPGKIAKTGEPIELRLVETDDVVATLGADKDDRWVVGFALEAEDHRLKALAKLERKHCDLMVSNGPSAIDASDNQVELLDSQGNVLAAIEGSKRHVADRVIAEIDRRLIQKI